MTKSLVIINRSSITMAGLIIDYLFSSDEPALEMAVPTRLRYGDWETTATGWELPNNHTISVNFYALINFHFVAVISLFYFSTLFV